MAIGISLALVWFSPALASNSLKIGFVDMNKAMNECRAGKEAKGAINKEMEKLQRLVQERQKELQTLKESLEKQAPMLTPEARATREKDFQNKVRDYQRGLEDNQKEIQQKGMDMERTINLGIHKVIQKLGAEEGYTFILELNENLVLFSSKVHDITDRVIKAFDAQKK